jgi:RNA recognition motif-containing protein
MPHRKEATLAIKALNGKDILGRKLRVNEARNGTRPG